TTTSARSVPPASDRSGRRSRRGCHSSLPPARSYVAAKWSGSTGQLSDGSPGLRTSQWPSGSGTHPCAPSFPARSSRSSPSSARAHATTPPNGERSMARTSPVHWIASTCRGLLTYSRVASLIAEHLPRDRERLVQVLASYGVDAGGARDRRAVDAVER